MMRECDYVTSLRFDYLISFNSAFIKSLQSLFQVYSFGSETALVSTLLSPGGICPDITLESY